MKYYLSFWPFLHKCIFLSIIFANKLESFLMIWYYFMYFKVFNNQNDLFWNIEQYILANSSRKYYLKFHITKDDIKLTMTAYISCKNFESIAYLTTDNIYILMLTFKYLISGNRFFLITYMKEISLTKIELII